MRATTTRTRRLRWQLAIGQSALALVLVLGGTMVLARRNDDLRKTEAAIGAARDAEVLAEQVAPRLAANRSVEELLTVSGTRQVELTDGQGRHLLGARLSADRAIEAAITRTIDTLDVSASSDGVTVRSSVVGLQPLVTNGELIGVVVVAETAPQRQGWRRLFGLDPIAAGLLALLAAAMGWWLAGRITRPLASLTEQARSLVLTGSNEPPPRSRITEVAVLGSAIDLVGERVRAEAARRDELQLDLRRLSHELRTPLTTIRLRIDSVAEQVDEPSLAVVERQLDRLDRLAEQLSRLRHTRPEATVVDLCAVAAAAVDRLRPLADWGRVEMHLDAPRAVRVEAERAALEDAISNVVENAIKYSPRGSRVAISAQTIDAWGTLEVRDSGPGVTEAVRDVILRPGVRVVGSSHVRGTGQGLAIVAETLDRVGGRLEISDAPGGGALVRLLLPVTTE